MMRKILVATPSHNGDVCCDYALAMMEVFRLASANGCDVKMQFWMYSSIIAESRNILLGMAYEGGFDELVFIDADQGFNIYVDPTYTADHFGRHKFSGSFAAHLIGSLTASKQV